MAVEQVVVVTYFQVSSKCGNSHSAWYKNKHFGSLGSKYWDCVDIVALLRGFRALTISFQFFCSSEVNAIVIIIIFE